MYAPRCNIAHKTCMHFTCDCFLYGHIDGMFKVWHNDIGGVKSPHRLDIYEKEVAPLAGFNVASEDDAHAAVMALPV